MQNRYFHDLVLANIGFAANDQLLTHYTPIVFPVCRPGDVAHESGLHSLFCGQCHCSELLSSLALNALGKRPWLIIIATMITVPAIRKQ